MKRVNFGNTGVQVPAIVVGCMRMNSLEVTSATKHIVNAVEHDANFFDHADIYGKGECEELFGKALAMTDIKREDVLQELAPQARELLGIPSDHYMKLMVGFGYPEIKYVRGVQKNRDSKVHRYSQEKK